ncbi:MAG: carbon monoxide dehydrogenase subunit G [Halieaceae bacterium]|nr:carbon monoxide dehydrogenase subunit G [Halieaceae bacterium]
MDIQGEYKIGLAAQQVWNSLHDAETLKQCIPGCQEIKKLSDFQYQAKIVAAIGPVKAVFDTNIEMQNLQPPHSYTLVGSAKGGAAGFGNGTAHISLSESAEVTILRYTAKLKIGGKLAQVGARLVSGVTRKMADEFFGKFSSILDKDAEKVFTEEDQIILARSRKQNHFLFAGAATAVIIILYLFFTN